MKKLGKMVIALLLIVALGCVKAIPAKADTVQVTTFSDLMNALSYAPSNSIIEIGGFIEIPVQASIGYDNKLITLKRANSGSTLYFSPGAEGSTIKNITFDGAGVNATDSFVSASCGVNLTKCNFAGCQSTGDGGGFYVWDGSISFDSCNFTDNKASRGGAVVISNGSTVFNDCSFTGNEGNSLGGAVAVLSASSTVNFQDCVMTGNVADHGGAAASSGVIMAEGCKIYNNNARIKGNDLYIDEFGRLTINNSLDELKALYEADSVTLTGVFDDADTSVELGGTITGEKGLTFQLSTEEPTPTPTPGESGSSGSGASGSSQPQTTYNNTYSPTINNVVQAPKESTTDPTASPTPKTTKTGDSVEASATVSDGKEARTYTTKTDEAGNSSLEITEGQNTITININVGTSEGVEADPNGTPETSSQETVISEPVSTVSADPETVYIQKGSNWLDVVQMVLLGLIVLYLIKGDKIKGIFQRKSK